MKDRKLQRIDNITKMFGTQKIKKLTHEWCLRKCQV